MLVTIKTAPIDDIITEALENKQRTGSCFYKKSHIQTYIVVTNQTPLTQLCVNGTLSYRRRCFSSMSTRYQVPGNKCSVGATGVYGATTYSQY